MAVMLRSCINEMDLDMNENLKKKTKLLAMRDVTDLTSLSASSIRRLSQEKKFPQPVRVTDSRVAWLESDVTKWIDNVCMKGQASNDN